MSSVCVLAIIPGPKGSAPMSCTCKLSRNATVQQAISQIARQTQLSLINFDIVVNGNFFVGDRNSSELAAVCDDLTIIMLIDEKRSRSVLEPATVGDAAMTRKSDFSAELLAHFEPTQLEQHQKMLLLRQQRVGSMDTAAPAVSRRVLGGVHIGQPPPQLRQSVQITQPRVLSGGSPRTAASIVTEENIVSLLQLGIGRDDAIHALSSATSVDAAASLAMSKLLSEDHAAAPPRVSSLPSPLSLSLPTRASSAPPSLGGSLPQSQFAVWDRTLRCIALAAQGNTFAQDVLMCLRVPMMLRNNLSVAAALPHIFQGERRLGNIANWERSSAANDAMLKAIDYCMILDANPSAIPVPPPGCDPDVWEDSILLGRPSDSALDNFFADSKEQISQVLLRCV
jgi:hypothetical protein